MNNVNQSNRLLPGYSENSSFGGNDANSINKQYLAQQKQQLQPLAYTPSTTHPYSTNQILQPLTQFLLPTSHNTSPYSNATNQGHQLMSSNLVEDLHSGMAFHDNSLKNSRKRAFSKRSKTGCLTCRARRIKCDEAKPQCSHCLKSKRMCEYPTEEAINKKRNRRKKEKLPKSTTVPASVASANNNSANKSPILLSDIKQNSVLLPPIKNYIPQYPIKSLSISQATSSQLQPQPPHNIHSLQESSAFSKSPNPNYHTFQIPSDNLFTYPSYSASSPNNNLQSNVNYFTPPNSNSHSVSSHSTMNASSGIGSTVTNGNPDQSFFNSQMYYMNSNASPRSPSPSQHQSSQFQYHLTTVQPQNKQQKSHQQYYSTATQMPQVLSYIPSKKFDI